MKSDNYASGCRYSSSRNTCEPNNRAMQLIEEYEKQTVIFMAPLVLWILKETLTMPL
jgi:hypothetical protein